MKRFLILVLSVLCVFALFVGCDSEKPSENQNMEEDGDWTPNF